MRLVQNRIKAIFETKIKILVREDLKKNQKTALTSLHAMRSTRSRGRNKIKTNEMKFVYRNDTRARDLSGMHCRPLSGTWTGATTILTYKSYGE